MRGKLQAPIDLSPRKENAVPIFRLGGGGVSSLIDLHLFLNENIPCSWWESNHLIAQPIIYA